MHKPKFWDKKNSLFSLFLFPFSLLLQLLIVIKNNIDNKEKFSLPVICVGNIYLGGTGKTPVSIEIVEILKKINKSAAIIKKYYTAHTDEFKMIKSRQIPLFTNKLRSEAIKEAKANKYDCAVLDDGFQDSKINAKLNIICFNSQQLIGNGFTLPSGPLREPLSALKRSQIIIINGNINHEFENKIKNISKNIKIYYAKYLPVNIDYFKNHKLLAFAGIGNPENFFNLLEEYNLKIIKKISFPDHYNYSEDELNELVNFASKNNLKIVTTEKDFFRIKHLAILQIKCLNIKLEILDKDNFEKEIIKYL